MITGSDTSAVETRYLYDGGEHNEDKEKSFLGLGPEKTQNFNDCLELN